MPQTDVLSWLNANASAVQAVAAVASLVVATVAVVFGALAWRAARRQAAVSEAAERSRRWDERVQALQPVEIVIPRSIGLVDAGVNAGQIVLWVPVSVPSEPVLDLRVILRRGPPGSRESAIAGLGTLAPGSQVSAHLVVTELWEAAQASDHDPSPYELHLNWFGQLGQWVVQEYAYDFVGVVRGKENSLWRMKRWHVDPKVEGIDKLNVTFD